MGHWALGIGDWLLILLPLLPHLSDLPHSPVQRQLIASLSTDDATHAGAENLCFHLPERASLSGGCI